MSAIAFRVDASSSLGSGHLLRCEALARELASPAITIIFVTRTGDPKDIARLTDAGFVVKTLSEVNKGSMENDAQEFVRAISEYGRLQWVIVDSYELDLRWEAAVRHCTEKLLVIDDLANRPHQCDVLLDHNFYGQHKNPYSGLIPSSTHLLIGPRFSLLRPIFAQLGKAIRPQISVVKSVLICFGGSDPANHTASALLAIQPFIGSLDLVTVVVGPLNAHAKSIVAISLQIPKCVVVEAPHDLPARLRNCDLVIGAGGTMTWERACVGAPTVAVGIASNQAKLLKHLFEYGGALGVEEMCRPDVQTFSDLISVALKCPALLAGMAQRARTLVDGLGACRVAEVLLGKPISFRFATIDDSESIYLWRNNKNIRLTSLNSRKISKSQHRLWMEASLKDDARVLLIAECSGVAVGVVRFDFCEDVAEISLYRVPGPENRRLGLIRAATSWLRSSHPEVLCIKANVKSTNTASYMGFLSAGYCVRRKEMILEISND